MSAATLLAGAMAGGADGLSERDSWLCLAGMYSGPFTPNDNVLVVSGLTGVGLPFNGVYNWVAVRFEQFGGNGLIQVSGPNWVLNDALLTVVFSNPAAHPWLGTWTKLLPASAIGTLSVERQDTSERTADEQLAAAIAKGYDRLSEKDILLGISYLLNA